MFLLGFVNHFTLVEPKLRLQESTSINGYARVFEQDLSNQL